MTTTHKLMLDFVDSCYDKTQELVCIDDVQQVPTMSLKSLQLANQLGKRVPLDGYFHVLAAKLTRLSRDGAQAYFQFEG